MSWYNYINQQGRRPSWLYIFTNNNNDGGDENNKNTEDHSLLEVPHPKKGAISQIDFYLVFP